ncbi:uncharacterized protein [Diadema antillarum]|uniref:uncharacterized protein n=1 Tax=Diadema antillarum TaxID=105358 RepID=UPI003A8A063E
MGFPRRASAWLSHEENNLILSQVTLNQGAHLAIASETTVDTVQGYSESSLQVLADARLRVESALDADVATEPLSTLHFFRRTPGSITLTRKVVVRGSLLTEGPISLTVGGYGAASLDVYPDPDAGHTQFLQLLVLDVRREAQVTLHPSPASSVCGYSLRINNLDEGRLVMAPRSSLKVACPSEIIARTVALADVTFDTVGSRSPSHINTTELEVIGNTDAGVLQIDGDDSYSIDVTQDGVLSFQPVNPDFVFGQISVDGNITSNQPLHVVTSVLSIGPGGIFQWPGVSNSIIQCPHVSVGGTLYPGESVDFLDGIRTFNVTSTGRITASLVAPLRVEHVFVDGIMNILTPTLFIPYDDSETYIGDFVVGPNGVLTLSAQPGSSEVHSIKVRDLVIEGSVIAENFDIGRDGLDRLVITNGGLLWFRPVDSLMQIGHISVDGNITASVPLHLDCSSLSVGPDGILQWPGQDQSILECHNVIIEGVLSPGARVDFGRGIYSFEVGAGGRVTLTPNSPFYVETVYIDGVMDILEPVSFVPYPGEDVIQKLKIGPDGILTLASKRSDTLPKINSLDVESLLVEGTFNAENLDIGSDGINTVSVNGSFTFTAEDVYLIHQMDVSGYVECSNALTLVGLLNDSYLEAYRGSNIVINSGQLANLSSSFDVALDRLATNGALTVIGRADFHLSSSFQIDDDGVVQFQDRGIPLEDASSNISTGSLEVDGQFFSPALSIKADSLSLGPDAVISVSEGGHLSDDGPGAGAMSSSGASGASHGGRGGHGGGADATQAGMPYGSLYTRGTLGSGGGSGTTDGSGGRGGGFMHAMVKGAVTIYGQVRANGQAAKGLHAGGGSGGAVWVSCDIFQGSGRVYADGGSGQGQGGGGAGGRVFVQAQTISFDDANFGAAGGDGAHVGGPGLTYIESSSPSIRLVRVDNKCRKPVVDMPDPSDDRATAESYNDFTLSSGVAWLDEGFHDLTAIRINGSAHLAIFGNGTDVNVGNIDGDETGYIHVGPTQTLNITDVWPYKRHKASWQPVIYESATLVLPEATFEVRAPFDWNEFASTSPYACPAGHRREPDVTIWGILDGGRGHLLVGTGALIRMAMPSYRSLQFVGITIQDGGILQLDSQYNSTQDSWHITVSPGIGEGQRSGTVTVEGGGLLTARALVLETHSLVIDEGGLLSAEGLGLSVGPGSPGSTTSGAGHGGQGGWGSDQDTEVGTVYGSLRHPWEFGSGIGDDSRAGGGMLRLIVDSVLTVDGTLQANGNLGCSGGSVWINTEELEGSGVVQVNGGSGSTQAGGGGGGGRLAVYYQEKSWWFGKLQAYGGTAAYGNGGAGIVYLQDVTPGVSNQTLYISSNNRAPPSEVVPTPGEISLDSSRTWLSDEESNETVAVDTLMLVDGAHFAVHPDIELFHAGRLIGDQSSFLHVGPGQVFVVHVTEWEELEANIHIYEGGTLLFPPSFTCYNVVITIRGTISAHDITVGSGCRLLFSETGTSSLLGDDLQTSLDVGAGNLAGHYRFDSLIVADGGEVTMVDDLPATNRSFTLTVDTLRIRGGGRLHEVDFIINANRLIVDDLGMLVADEHDIPCVQPDGDGSEASQANTGASGAGHGGRGGRGTGQRITGAPFGHLFEPSHLGCRGGGTGGGLGGGRMLLVVNDTLKVDGEVSADGGAGASYADGGGSGGSIEIHTRLMQGYGRVTANGGDGQGYTSNFITYYGGGGSGGRVAVYFSLNRTFSGSFEAQGGSSGGSTAGHGGPGTMFFYHTEFNHRTLIIDNKGKPPVEDDIQNYSDLSEDSGRAWILPSSGNHNFSGNHEYYFEEFQLLGNAHLALRAENESQTTSLYFENMIGDRTGTLHIGPNQVMDLYRPQIDLPFNTRVYSSGTLGLANDTIVHGVTITLDGTLVFVTDIVLHHGGRLLLNRGGKTALAPVDGHYEFNSIHVQDDGYIRMTSDPVIDPGMTFRVRSLQIDGGGIVEATHLYIHAENITIDAGGVLSADGQGYSQDDGDPRYPNGTFRMGLHGVINFGKGFEEPGAGSSGGGHGGSGGHGIGVRRTGRPYSDLYEPTEFGSAGGGGAGGAGGGRIWFNVTDTIHIDGVVSANGAVGGESSGGGSGGSIWMHCNLIKGYGSIATNGGGGGSQSGGGAGGRVALYFWQNRTSTGFKFESHGGAPSQSSQECEGGGPGTIFLYHMFHDHRSLFIENGNLVPKQKLIDWQNLEEDGCRGWILPISGSHDFAGSNNEFLFEELQIYDGAHVAILPPNQTEDSLGVQHEFFSHPFGALSTEGFTVSSAPILHFLHMIGDRTGAVHLADMQEMDLEREDIDLPFSVYVYRGAHLGLAPRTVVHGVEIYNAGTLSHIVNLTLHHGGYMWLRHGGHTTDEPESHYQFEFVRIQDSGWLNAVTDPILEPGITFISKAFFIEGGGRMQGSRLTILSQNITVDDAGLLSADGTGYSWHHDNVTHGSNSLHGTVNPGKPPDDLGFRAGGSHGGTGGRAFLPSGGSGQQNSNSQGTCMFDNSGCQQHMDLMSVSGRAGLPYGDLYEPYVFGSSGGLGSEDQPGAAGGGIIWMNVTDTLHIDGEVTARGSDGDGGAGGGSGGSMWIFCTTVKGYGRFSVDGGNGFIDSSAADISSGGGGGGGRFALYFKFNQTSTGFSYHARGGEGWASASSQMENGGAGTVFIYDMTIQHRTLILDNGGLQPRTPHHTLWNYAEIALDGCRSWILPQSGRHFFANGTYTYHFEELQVNGAAHAAVLTDPVDSEATLFFLYMIGDRTGTLHIGFNQTLDLERPEIDLPFSTRVYHGGYLGLAPDTTVHDVSIWMHGTLGHIIHLVIRHYGVFSMEHGGHTEGHNSSFYSFKTIVVQDFALMSSRTSTTLDPGITLNVGSLDVEGGGEVRFSHAFIQAENLTIDDGGHLHSDGFGYNTTNILNATNGVNIGRGNCHISGSSGGGHGGTSGRGVGADQTGQPYGNLYEPFDFGSVGGGDCGGGGGGFLLLNISDTVKIDGVMSADGKPGGNGRSGGGSGGSILMTCNLIQGRGKITANGGSSGDITQSGGGAGGRISVYLWRNETFRGRFVAHGGVGYEPGGPGTVFLYHLVHEHRTLLVDNDFLSSSHVSAVESYADITTDSFKAWVLPQSGEHHFAGGKHDYHFDELQIYGNAHFAILMPTPNDSTSLHFRHMIGDRSGVIHVGPNQVVDLRRDFLDTPFSSYVYQDGYLGLGHDTVLSYVFVHIAGTVDHIHNLTLYNGAAVQAQLAGSTNRLPARQFRFNGTVTVKSRSVFNFSSPFAHGDAYLLKTGDLIVEGGGKVYGKNFVLESLNLTVDDGGFVDVSDGGYLAERGRGAGVLHHLGSSGASHGGLGGRGECRNFTTCFLPKNLPYGSVYWPRDFGSGGAGADGGIGGGMLHIIVEDTLRVDGTIAANSLDLPLSSVGATSSGGSGGSILVETGAFVGGHTGSIEARGGAARFTNGASGAGGRIAIYHRSNVTHGEYHGALITAGGAIAASGAEAGASGTAYLQHTVTGYSVLQVDNAGRRPVTKEIENIGRRLNMDGGAKSKSRFYSAPSGVTVTSTVSAFDDHRTHTDDQFYFLAYLFDQTFSNDARSYYRSDYSSSSPVLTFDLGQVFFVNFLRVHVACAVPSSFRVTSALSGVSHPVTETWVSPPSPCEGSEPFIELPVKRRADTLIISLQRSSSSTAALSEVEIYVGESHVHSRYEFRELDSARTWIEGESGTNSHMFDKLHITGGAQLAFMPNGNLIEPVTVQVGELLGDSTELLHPTQKGTDSAHSLSYDWCNMILCAV